MYGTDLNTLEFIGLAFLAFLVISLVFIPFRSKKLPRMYLFKEMVNGVFHLFVTCWFMVLLMSSIILSFESIVYFEERAVAMLDPDTADIMRLCPFVIVWSVVAFIGFFFVRALRFLPWKLTPEEARLDKELISKRKVRVRGFIRRSFWYVVNSIKGGSGGSSFRS